MIHLNLKTKKKKLMGLKAIMKIQILIESISFLKHCFKYKATYLFKVDSYMMDKLPPPKCASLWGLKRGEKQAGHALMRVRYSHP